MMIRHVEASDFERITPVINDWWGGRQMTDKLPRMFFEHFNNTSFIAEKDGELAGFLIGFLSQSNPVESYIHFVGVHPDYRKLQVGKTLYEAFYQKAKKAGCKTVRCITSPSEQSVHCLPSENGIFNRNRRQNVRRRPGMFTLRRTKSRSCAVRKRAVNENDRKNAGASVARCDFYISQNRRGSPLQ